MLQVRASAAAEPALAMIVSIAVPSPPADWISPGEQQHGHARTRVQDAVALALLGLVAGAACKSELYTPRFLEAVGQQ